MQKKTSNGKRYGIHEWFGTDLSLMSESERKRAAVNALASTLPEVPCPHMSALRSAFMCSKKGGVCSIRQYERNDVGVAPSPGGLPVTVCPQRLMQGGALLRWAGEILLGTSHPIAIKEIPFLARVGATGELDAKEKERKAGRIDWVLIHPDISGSLKWCAVETQAVYFSGKAMDSEFESLASASGNATPFPTAVRRPDYRSSGPKRLAPQLQVKVPELRAWGAKTAVIVDEYFFSEMSDLPQVRGNDSKDQLSNAEVIWLIAKNDAAGLLPSRVVYARLEESVRALNATQPISRDAFVRELRNAIEDPKMDGRKVFRL
jgi:Restriction endonuclease NotI